MFKKVLVLYTGGTIGMQRNDNGVLAPAPGVFLQKIKYHLGMHDREAEGKYFRPLKENELILPSLTGLDKIIYEIREYSPLLDSSNVSCEEWINIAMDIEDNYNKYEGFVVLHGTDTMAYTSSALSFMLGGLEKPVIVTGSQIPVFATYSDAKDNFLSAITIAAYYAIPEVCVFFGNKLFRGNRTTKISSDAIAAFDSPNYHTLADVGIDVKINHHYLRKSDGNIPFVVDTKLNSNVAVLTFFPTITNELLANYFKPPIQGVVIKSYGAGNIPSNRILLDVLKDAVQREILIVNVTQCSHGAVHYSYECGEVLRKLGVISGTDMTTEAALTKLCYVLGIPGLTYQQRIEIMETNIRGELTNRNLYIRKN